MSQITLYLDDATQALVEQAAKANGVSKSRWVADIIRTYASHDWPRDCLALAGRFTDFPLREDAPAMQGEDVPRHGF
jgi:hypothetical protein